MALLSGGKHAARKLKRAQILLAADAGVSDDAIATGVGVGGSTVYRTKQRFVLGNLEAALSEQPRPGASRKLSDKQEALLVATACSSPPAGRSRWTLELLAGEVVRLTEHDSVSRETVGRRLAENDLALAQGHVVHSAGPTASTSPAWRMCSISMPKSPIRSALWSVSTRAQPSSSAKFASPIPAEPGQLERYRLRAQAQWNSQPVHLPRPWRKVKVTDRRAAVDFAACMRELTDVHFPEADDSGRARQSVDPLPWFALSAFPACEARRVLRWLEFHYVPKHASWLNMVEIEIGVLRSQCLDRRVATKSAWYPRSLPW